VPDISDMFGLGPYLRAQRRLAKLSLRQMAELAGVSNPYLSQIERGLHEPSVRILRSIAEALNLSADTVLEQAGLWSREEPAPTGTEDAIRHDPDLNEDQKLALLSVYRSYRSQAQAATEGAAREGGASEGGGKQRASKGAGREGAGKDG
jgi:transcriptional regulator with XRE-family HTH domain